VIGHAKSSFNLCESHDSFREGMYVRYYNHSFMRWDRLWIKCVESPPDGERDAQSQDQADLISRKGSWIAPPSLLMDAQSLAAQEEWLAKLEYWDIWTAPLLQTSQLLDFCRQALCNNRTIDRM